MASRSCGSGTDTVSSVQLWLGRPDFCSAAQRVTSRMSEAERGTRGRTSVTSARVVGRQRTAERVRPYQVPASQVWRKASRTSLFCTHGACVRATSVRCDTNGDTDSDSYDPDRLGGRLTDYLRYRLVTKLRHVQPALMNARDQHPQVVGEREFWCRKTIFGARQNHSLHLNSPGRSRHPVRRAAHGRTVVIANP